MRIDLSGQRFGHLLVLNEYEIRKEGKQNNPACYWKCKCDCGTEKFIAGTRLRNRGQKSCGKGKCANRKKQIDFIIGQKFGKLIVQKRLGLYKNSREYLFLCECDCGKNIELVKNRILTSRQCKDCYYNSIKKDGFGDILWAYWHQIFHSAKRRNIIFDLSIEDAWKIFINQNKKCKLTNRPIKFAQSFSSNENKSQQTASLDRIDSSKGYTIDNIQWIHKDVNKMKMDLNQDYFIQICQEVSNNVSKIC